MEQRAQGKRGLTIPSKPKLELNCHCACIWDLEEDLALALTRLEMKRMGLPDFSVKLSCSSTVHHGMTHHESPCQVWPLYLGFPKLQN